MENFLPVKIHIKENPAGFHRFDVQWTPSLLVLDSGGKERYRFEGYLPAEDFLAHLEFGQGRVAFAHKDWDAAARHFDSVYARDKESDLAPEALYWAGVSRYKKTQDPKALQEMGARVRAEFPGTTWAKRALPYAGESAKA